MLDEETKEKIREMLKSGVRNKDVSKKLGVTENQVAHYKAMLNGTKKYKKRDKPSPKVTEIVSVPTPSSSYVVVVGNNLGEMLREVRSQWKF